MDFIEGQFSLKLDHIINQCSELSEVSLDDLLSNLLLLHDNPVVIDELLVLGLTAGLLDAGTDENALVLRLGVSDESYRKHQLFIALFSLGEDLLSLAVDVNINLCIAIEDKVDNPGEILRDSCLLDCLHLVGLGRDLVDEQKIKEFHRYI